MGKKTKLHEAAERGESEELQRLLDTRAYDVNEGDEGFLNVCEERERVREREREVLTYSFFLLISTLWIVCEK
jgi:hypothetical protein